MTLQTQRKKIFFRRAWLAVVVLVLSVLQNTDGWFPQIFGARALLLIPVTAVISMYEKDIAGMFYGLFAGALWDICAGGNNFNTIYLFVVGYACGVLINTIMRNNFVTHLLLSGVATSLYCFVYWLWHYVIAGTDRAFFILFRYYFPTTIYTIVLSPFIFFLVRFVEKKYRSGMMTDII